MNYNRVRIKYICNSNSIAIPHARLCEPLEFIDHIEKNSKQGLFT